MPPLPRRTLLLALLVGLIVLGLYTYSPDTVFHADRPAVDIHQPVPVPDHDATHDPKPPAHDARPPIVAAPPPIDSKVESVEESTFGTDPVPVAPRLTLIALWSPQDDRPSIHIPNFIASAAANPSLSLLLVKFDKYKLGNGQCEQPLVKGDGYANVREVCMGLDEYFERHVGWLCGEWGCSEAQRRETRDVLEERLFWDRVNSHYRPFRAEIFGDLLHADTPLWAWVDLDVFLGSFERMFPWDLSPYYDVILAGWPTGDNSRVQVFMPGHFTAFRRSKEVAREFMKLERLSSFEKWKARKWEWDSPEESEYSYHLFTSTPLTFLRLGTALADSAHHISALAPGGIYALENAWWADRDPSSAEADPALRGSTERAFVSLRAQINDAVEGNVDKHAEGAGSGAAGMQTFSADGVEREVEIRAGADAAAGLDLWFPPQFFVAYESTLGPSFANNGADTRRYLMRRAPNGPVTERIEPERPLLVSVPPGKVDVNARYSTGNRPWLREGLYNHFQHEKYRDWWALPPNALKAGERMYVDRAHGAHVWDARGRIVWESPRVRVERR